MRIAELADYFAKPPRHHTVRPFWFWNGPLTPAETARQIDRMMEQGVYGAYIDCRSGLRPRYLSEDWWELVAATAAHAERVGFLLGALDEYNWPCGDARDFTLPGIPSRVLARRPDVRMRRVAFERQPLAAGERGQVVERADGFAVVGEHDGAGELVPESLRRVEPGELVADAPSCLYRFHVVDTVGFDGGLVDLLNPDATEVYIELVYEEYRRRLGDRFGGAFFGFFVDHEGDYGKRIAWTPGLAGRFEAHYGYDLGRVLPLLIDEGGTLAVKVRCDYLALIAELYSSHFLGRLSAWGREHGVSISGHCWEESLHATAAYQGDHFAIQRALDQPGIDSLFEWGRYPRHFVEAGSVAHFRDAPLVVENQGVQGMDGALDLEGLKRTTNAIAVWGTTDLIPHAFHGNLRRVEFPEDWFEAQPWWPQFRAYADLASRLCLLNSATRKRARVLVYHPKESAWAHASPVFDEERWDYGYTGFDLDRGPWIEWGNEVDEIDRVYGEAIEAIAMARHELLVADSDYLSTAGIEPGRLTIGEDAFDVLVLPPMTTIARGSLELIVRHAEGGGRVLTLGRLPSGSPEHGAEDPEVAALVERLTAAPGHRAVASVAELPALLDAELGSELKLERGAPDELLASTRALADGTVLHLLVNRSGEALRWELAVPSAASLELWRPESGRRETVAAGDAGGDGVRVEVALERWESAVLVRAVEPTGAEQPAPGASWEAEERLAGPWRMRFEPSEVVVPWASTRECAPGEGTPLGWALPSYNDRHWESARIARDEETLRDWWIIGPYPYGTHEGFDWEHPPELRPDPAAVYESGPERWAIHQSPERLVDLSGALGLATPSWDGERWTTAYALTFVEAEAPVEGELRVVPESNVKAWVNGELAIAERDDHHGYMEYHDGFAVAGRVKLPAGRSSILLKISQGFRMGATIGFVARLCDDDGRQFAGVRPAGPGAHFNGSPAERWYRLPVPPGARSVWLPAGADAWYDGEPVDVTSDGATELPASAGPGVLAIRLGPGRRLAEELRFATTESTQQLGSLSLTGASWHCGRVRYATRFSLHGDSWRRVELDLGEVGATATVTVNGVEVGARPWAPFTFDITAAAATGANELEVEVANTNAQRRAGLPAGGLWGDRATSGLGLLARLERNGLIGPVTVRCSSGGR